MENKNPGLGLGIAAMVLGILALCIPSWRSFSYRWAYFRRGGQEK
jgi:hypothetical protein